MLKTEEKTQCKKLLNYFKMLKSLRFSLVLFFISNITYAQKEKFEDKETVLLKEYVFFTETNDFEKKETQSIEFSKKIKNFILENPKTLSYDFKKLKDRLYIITSNDEKLRFYTWNTELGGTMPSFDQIIQYSSNGDVKTIYNKEQSGSPYFVSEIIKTSVNNQTYYLVISNGIFSTKDNTQTVQAFTIRNNKLIDSDKIFKTKNKTLNKIQINFDFFSVVDRPERPVRLIQFEKNKLYIPIVNKEGVVSSKFLVYQLKNSYFQYVGIK